MPAQIEWGLKGAMKLPDRKPYFSARMLQDKPGSGAVRQTCGPPRICAAFDTYLDKCLRGR
jgi:hypothetical protein